MAINFEALRGEILSTARTAGDKFNDASAQARKRLTIRSKEDFIQQKYAELGRAYYEAHRDAGECTDFPELFTEIQKAEDEIASMNDDLMAMQGAIVCPNCGMKQSRDHIFCSGCGKALQ